MVASLEDDEKRAIDQRRETASRAAMRCGAISSELASSHTCAVAQCVPRGATPPFAETSAPVGPIRRRSNRAARVPAHGTDDTVAKPRTTPPCSSSSTVPRPRSADYAAEAGSEGRARGVYIDRRTGSTSGARTRTRVALLQHRAKTCTPTILGADMRGHTQSYPATSCESACAALRRDLSLLHMRVSTVCSSKRNTAAHARRRDVRAAHGRHSCKGRAFEDDRGRRLPASHPRPYREYRNFLGPIPPLKRIQKASAGARRLDVWRPHADAIRSSPAVSRTVQKRAPRRGRARAAKGKDKDKDKGLLGLRQMNANIQDAACGLRYTYARRGGAVKDAGRDSATARPEGRSGCRYGARATGPGQPEEDAVPLRGRKTRWCGARGEPRQ
ncbi:hypothetical protein GGX14DRAFT_634230 [Mycena pura]|uniref:Uncharacterized protein n=1 Tax=Mycena pura TaxID=153505 RepID=A0AAD6VI59_9AGAR|nr:hypothetical protein GGX14DRAFT_634230 [Mycena pura]